MSDRRWFLDEWAREFGFESTGQPGDDEVTRLTLRILASVMDRDIDNVLHGIWEDADVAVFDLRRGSGSSAVLSSCALTALPYDFPATILMNRRAADGLESLLALPMLDIPTSAIAQAYEVRTNDRAFVDLLLDGELATWLVEWADQSPHLGFELGGSWLLTFTPLVDPDGFHELLNGLLAFRDRIPDGIFDAYPMSDQGSS